MPLTCAKHGRVPNIDMCQLCDFGCFHDIHFPWWSHLFHFKAPLNWFTMLRCHCRNCHVIIIIHKNTESLAIELCHQFILIRTLQLTNSLYFSLLFSRSTFLWKYMFDQFYRTFLMCDNWSIIFSIYFPGGMRGGKKVIIEPHRHEGTNWMLLPKLKHCKKSLFRMK